MVRNTDLLVNGQHLRLGDIAKVSRGVSAPPSPRMRVQGQPAIGLGVVMEKGGNVIDLGENLRVAMAAAARALPVGIELHVIANQPEVVNGSIHLFESSLTEAVLIVLAVAFLSLGWRTGAGGGVFHPAGIADYLLFDENFWHRLAAHFARCVGHRARAVG